MKQLKKGLFISLEGIDGSGKTTLAQSLDKKLRADGFQVVLTREPGGSELGKKLRTLLKDPHCNVSHQAEYLLFAADRAQHMKEVIDPALAAGNIVLSDRFSDSSVTYQGYGRGLDVATIELINAWVTHAQEPDLTFYIEISLDTAQQRKKIRNNEDRFDEESRLFYERVINGYNQLCAQYPRIVRLDGQQIPEHIVQRAYNLVLATLKNMR